MANTVSDDGLFRFPINTKHVEEDEYIIARALSDFAPRLQDVHAISLEVSIWFTVSPVMC